MTVKHINRYLILLGKSTRSETKLKHRLSPIRLLEILQEDIILCQPPLQREQAPSYSASESAYWLNTTQGAVWNNLLKLTITYIL